MGWCCHTQGGGSSFHGDTESSQWDSEDNPSHGLLSLLCCAFFWNVFLERSGPSMPCFSATANWVCLTCASEKMQEMDTLQFFPLSTTGVWLASQWPSCELCYADATAPITYPGHQSCINREQELSTATAGRLGCNSPAVETLLKRYLC